MSAPTGYKKKPPPAFQMYSSDRLADRPFKMMSLAERGLLHTLELECWCNRNVPANIDAMARTLGLNASEVKDALSDLVLAHFTQAGDNLTSPELETYREKLDKHHRLKSEGGKKGMAHRWPNNTDNSVNNSVNNTLNNSLKGEERKGEKTKGVFKEVVSSLDKNDEFVRALDGDSPALAEATRRYSEVRG